MSILPSPSVHSSSHFVSQKEGERSPISQYFGFCYRNESSRRVNIVLMGLKVADYDDLLLQKK